MTIADTAIAKAAIASTAIAKAAVEPRDEDLLGCDVSDEALEIAARAPMGAAMSFPGAPTVNVLVVCCGNDVTA